MAKHIFTSTPGRRVGGAEMADDMRSVKGDFIKMDVGAMSRKWRGWGCLSGKGGYYYTMPKTQPEAHFLHEQLSQGSLVCSPGNGHLTK